MIERMDWLIISFIHFFMLAAGATLQMYLTYSNWKLSLKLFMSLIIIGVVFVLLGLIDNSPYIRIIMSHIYLVAASIGIFIFCWFNNKHIALRMNALVVLAYIIFFWIMFGSQLLHFSNIYQIFTVFICISITFISLYLTFRSNSAHQTLLELILYTGVIIFIGYLSINLFSNQYSYISNSTDLAIWSIRTFDMFSIGGFLVYISALSMSILLMFPLFNDGHNFKTEIYRAQYHRRKVNEYFHNSVFTMKSFIVFVFIMSVFLSAHLVFNIPLTTIIYFMIFISGLLLQFRQKKSVDMK